MRERRRGGAATLGVDVGTSGTTGVQDDGEGAVIIRSATGERAVEGPHSTAEWNPSVGSRLPDPEVRDQHHALYSRYRELYTSTTATVHALAARERRTAGTTPEEPR